MCLITIAPSGVKTLDWDTLEYSHKRNHDGFGFAWFDGKDGIWVAVRRLEPFDELKKALGNIPDDAPVVIHQRMSTKGSVSIYNTHPFSIGDDALLFHNGTISDTGADYEWFTGEKDDKGEKIYAKREWSDTNAFAQIEVAPIVKGCGAASLKEWWATKLLESRIGYSSVVVITIDGDPDPLILNEKKGDWIDVDKDEGTRLYYSNSYSRPGRVTVYGGSSYQGGHFSGGSYGGSSKSSSPASHYGYYSELYEDSEEVGGGTVKTLQDAAAEQHPDLETAGVQQEGVETDNPFGPPETGDRKWADMTTNEREDWVAYLNAEYNLHLTSTEPNTRGVDFDQYIAFAQFEVEQAALAEDEDADEDDELAYYRRMYGYRGKGRNN